MDKKEHKPHCLILPYPSQGHINPLIQFSKRLAHKGITITFAVPQGVLVSSAVNADIAVETISDGYNAATRADADPQEYLASFKKAGTESTSRLIEELREGRGGAVDCVVYDAFLPWGLAVAKSKGLFGAAFFTQTSSVNAVYYSVFKGLLKVPVSERETVLPGLPPLGVADLPSFVVDPEKRPGMLELLVGQFEGVEDSHFVFVNSVYELEEEANEWMKKSMSVKTIGPAIPSIYLDKRLQHDTNYGLSMFKPDDTCMKWLQQRPPKSVIYVSFGSIAKLEEREMEELATALKLTGRHFLWVVRSSEASKLPANFAGGASGGKGLVVPWCSQLEVLAHDAVGCFVTHCGWNSTLEALSLGVPMVGVPWWSDQSTNAKFVADVWKVGVRACPDEEGVVGREELARCVECVMEGEEMRENARKWKELAKGAADEGGSSDRNIHEFVSTLMGGVK
ncbi:mogroside IE synthase-like [Salvia divinorum]|uniref:Glycosyltransferase n=1 Tax=Salvia divinorum TaxID=28513 RepID=A0ABD1HC84_SALDI